eukprot:15466624-Alexandrium_andersonii.AAC.2
MSVHLHLVALWFCMTFVLMLADACLLPRYCQWWLLASSLLPVVFACMCYVPWQPSVPLYLPGPAHTATAPGAIPAGGFEQAGES